MKHLLFPFFLLGFFFSSAQNPLVKQWDKRFGGIDEEVFTSFQETSDGGFILGGYSYSVLGGDKTEGSRGEDDFWIVKADSLGSKQWDKRFGGNSFDELYCFQQTNDGGYILGGMSTSGMNGDKTQNPQDTSSVISGKGDYWIVKTDALGNKEWDKRFGGLNVDQLFSLQQSIDGGYILGGMSKSGIGGDKTQTSCDTSANIYAGAQGDYWVVKIDSQGDKLWDKRFGGLNIDAPSSLQETIGGGYILGGNSRSGIGGDKTQDCWGGWDYWIVKIDAAGIKQWDKRFGGTGDDVCYSLQQTSDGGYILGGISKSGISGDKTQASWDISPNPSQQGDYWIVKIDGAGIKQWDKRFGGENNEGPVGNIFQTSDNGYIMAGISTSGVGGDKSEITYNASDIWVVKTDWLGNKQWDKTIFVTGLDKIGKINSSGDGCYTIAGQIQDTGGYCTQPSRGGNDYWIIKFCIDTSIHTNATDLKDNTYISLSPNPFTTTLSISIQKENLQQADFTIINIIGHPVYTKHESNLSSTYTKTLELGYLPAGVYFLEVIAGGERSVRQLVKQ